MHARASKIIDAARIKCNFKISSRNLPYGKQFAEIAYGFIPYDLKQF